MLESGGFISWLSMSPGTGALNFGTWGIYFGACLVYSAGIFIFQLYSILTGFLSLAFHNIFRLIGLCFLLLHLPAFYNIFGFTAPLLV
ncbi:hypothetical protein EV702DRAFT_1101701 [Suillus placidus]|uniref:Uncharacterized protein n=1 Tax=Suillus placidus TaxID=48579 RepID=A0A9P6ZVW5_9AGAM|nr:hypothetical protein EV702DRAFT_1101701 [Suillus placidus]